nr:MAG TPA: hypothetical protein [Caudoviricetes sp.]
MIFLFPFSLLRNFENFIKNLPMECGICTLQSPQICFMIS